MIAIFLGVQIRITEKGKVLCDVYDKRKEAISAHAELHSQKHSFRRVYGLVVSFLSHLFSVVSFLGSLCLFGTNID